MICSLCGLEGAVSMSNADGPIGAACVEGACGGLVWERSALDALGAGRTWREVHAWECRRQRAAQNWLAFYEPPPVSILSPATLRTMRRAAT